MSYPLFSLMIWSFTILLQPIKKNLEAKTYENFEKDIAKSIQVWQCVWAILNFMHSFIYICLSLPLFWVSSGLHILCEYLSQLGVTPVKQLIAWST